MKLRKNELSVLMLIMVSVALIMIVLNPRSFLTVNNLQSMAFQLPELGILSLGMMIVMLTGGINLSIIATANMAGITAALILTSGNGDAVSAGTVLLAVLAALAVSALIGLVNGVLVAYVGITPILATLGTMTLLNGLTIVITKGYVISGFPAVIEFIGNGTIWFIPFPLILFIIMVLIMSLVLNKTSAGFSMYMIGSNDIATRFSGIDNAVVLLKTYMLSGVFSGVAALVMISRFNSARANYGDSYLLVTILASVLGGVSSEGGFGRVSGVVIALVTLQMISSGLNLLRVSAFMTTALWGLLMITVMVIDHLMNQRKERGHV